MCVSESECTRADDGNGVVQRVLRDYTTHIPPTCSPSNGYVKGGEKETATYEKCTRVCKRDTRATELNWLGMDGEEEGNKVLGSNCACASQFRISINVVVVVCVQVNHLCEYV